MPVGVAGIMRSRVVSAALVVLAGVWVAPSAFAAAPIIPFKLAPAPAPSVSFDRTGHLVNFNLGGVMTPGLLQDSASLRPMSIGVSRGVELELSRGRNWDPYADLFPASASLSSFY